jgi:hypothetical protein
MPPGALLIGVSCLPPHSPAWPPPWPLLASFLVLTLAPLWFSRVAIDSHHRRHQHHQMSSDVIAPSAQAIMAIVTTLPPYAILNAAIKRLSPNDYVATLPTCSAL